MTIKLSVQNMNDILKMAKQFIDKKNVRPTFTQITLHLKDKRLSAVAPDGCSMGIIRFPYEREDAQGGSMMIPLLPLFGKDDAFCEITQDAKETIIKTAIGSQSYRRVNGDPLDDYEHYLPKEEKRMETFYFNPKRLAAALTAFSGSEAVKIDYYGQLGGVVITDGNKKAFVCPFRPKSYKQ